MRLEDIAQTGEARNLRRLLYRERFGLSVEKEPVIGVLGVGEVAKKYLMLVSTNKNSLLYNPRYVLIGREQETSEWKRRHNSSELSILIRENRFSTMDYSELAGSINIFDLLFITIGTETNSSNRLEMTKSNLIAIEDSLNRVPFSKFNGLCVVETNPAEVCGQYIVKHFGFKDPRQVICNGPLDLMRGQYTLVDLLELNGISGSKIRLSVGGNHIIPYFSANNVLLEQDFSSDKKTVYLRDISEKIKELESLLKKRGTSISELAKNLAFQSFKMQEKYSGNGTPTTESTAESMAELTRAIINRFGSTAVSVLSEKGFFEYGNYHFTNGFPEPDEERIQSFSIKDLDEIGRRNEELRRILIRRFGNDYAVKFPSDTIVLESIFCPRGRQEPEELEEIIINIKKEHDYHNNNKSKRSGQHPPLREILKNGISSTIYFCNCSGNTISSYRFNKRFNPQMNVLSMDSLLSEREINKTTIKDLVYISGKVIGLIKRFHGDNNHEYRFVVWDSERGNPELITNKFSDISGKQVDGYVKLDAHRRGVRFSFESKNRAYVASYNFNEQKPRILFSLPSLPSGNYDYNGKTLSICDEGIFIDGKYFSAIDMNLDGWTGFARKNSILFYSTDSGLYVTDLENKRSTVVNSEGYAKDVIECGDENKTGIQIVTFTEGLGAVISEYDSKKSVLNGDSTERLIKDPILNKSKRVIIQDSNIFFVMNENMCYAIYHQNGNHHIERLPVEVSNNLGVGIYGI